MEHLLNVYASKAAKGSIADFVGYVEVDDEEATAKLTQGVWLVRKQALSKLKQNKTLYASLRVNLVLCNVDVEISG